MTFRTNIREKLWRILGISLLNDRLQGLENSMKGLSARDLIRELDNRATASSAEFIDQYMHGAKALDTKASVMNFALQAVGDRGSGLFCEFGVYQGSSINYIAERINTRIYGFDSFQGLPEHWRDGFSKGAFGLDAQQLPRCAANVELVVGTFRDTLPKFATDHPDNVSFLHIDCDLYSSARTIFD
jgi:hypothetical protein